MIAPAVSLTSGQICLRAMDAVLRAANPVSAIRSSVRIHDSILSISASSSSSASPLASTVIDIPLSKYKRTVIVGAGKASCEMAAALLHQFHSNSSINLSGLIITKTAHGKPEDVALCNLHGVRVVEASHPVPCEIGARAVHDMIHLLQSTASTDTLVIWLASGGGSALTGGVPVAASSGVSLTDVQHAFSVLLASGLAIEEMNTVRKHLCAAHGGRMALHAAGGKSTVLTLCLSDIIDSPVHSIAGGPTVADPTTLADCDRILSTLLSVEDAKAVRAMLRQEETPKSLPSNVLPPVVIMDNKLALERALQACREEMPSLRTVVLLTHRLDGEAAHVGKLLANLAHDITLERPFLMLAGGETTVTFDHSNGGGGVGGRNQELALAAAVQFARISKIQSQSQSISDDVSLLCIGTDGTDGPTPAAGAVVGPRTLDNDADAVAAAQRALQQHDAYTFFHNTTAPGVHLVTGPTGTNVMDLVAIAGV